MTKPEVPFDRMVIDAVLKEQEVDPGTASIRKIASVVSEVERRLGCKYLRMEFGVPGFEPNAQGIDAEIAALQMPRVASVYAPLLGLPRLKAEGARFLKSFLNLEIDSDCIIPTVGAMQGTFLAQAVASQCDPQKNTILFLDPSFSVYRTQTRLLGIETASVDLYERTFWLDRVERECAKGKIAAILYSSPNNPTWAILSEEEARRLGEISEKYDVILIEDAAYFGMDFREDYSIPNQPPYPSTAVRYTKNFIYVLSSSKIFNYAGQRLALTCISPDLGVREYPNLNIRFGYQKFFEAFVWSALYSTTSGAIHSAQYALAEFLAQANEGKFNFLEQASKYAERAKKLKQILTSNGFSLVYTKDLEKPLADGFFFTFCYPQMQGGELVRKLLYYGISTVALQTSCSERIEGVRGCTSSVEERDFPVFENRVQAFHQDHSRSKRKKNFMLLDATV